MDYIKIRFGNTWPESDETLDSKFEKTVEDMFRSLNPMFSLSERPWKPQMDIYETSEDIFILAEIAGVDKETLDVEINSKAVRICGNRADMDRQEILTYRLAEVQYGKFERVLFLPAPIDTDRVTASYQDGFLRIRLAKLPRDIMRKIPITDG